MVLFQHTHTHTHTHTTSPPAPNFVQSGPGEVVNNTFTRVGSSISIRSTVLSQHEGGDPSGIVVANNTLINVSMSPGGGGESSSPVTIGRLGERPVLTYTGIVISGNSMTLAGGASIFAESVANLTVRDNTFTAPCVITADVDPHSGTTARQAVFVSHATGVTVDGNTLVDLSRSCRQDPISHTGMLGLGKGTSNVVLDSQPLPPTPPSPPPPPPPPPPPSLYVCNNSTYRCVPATAPGRGANISSCLKTCTKPPSPPP